MTALIMACITVVFFPGVLLRVKSLSAGRKGPGLWQPWKNVRVLLHKKSVVSETTSFIFGLGPVVSLTAVVCAILLVPFPGQPSPLAFSGDFVLFAYLLALGRFFMIAGALDTGSSFEGMGASREALYSMLTEPAFFLLFGTLALLTGHTSMSEILETFRFSGHGSYIAGIIAVYLLIQIAMIENSRMPVDDPKTHLELTMIHEVIILDYSGFDLALIQIGNYLKFALYGLLIANFVVPATPELRMAGIDPGAGSFALRVVLVLCIQGIFAALIGGMESFRARKKMARNPQFIVTLSSIAVVAFVLVLLILNKLVS